MSNRYAPVVPALLIAPVAFAQEILPFPADVLLHDLDAEVLEFQPRQTELELLTTLDAVTMVGFPLPDGSTVDLALVRNPVRLEDYGMVVDGVQVAFDPLDMSLWSGHIDGNVSSHASLCLSSHGCYGWIFDGGQYTHISAYRGEDGGWSQARGRVYTDRALERVEGDRPQLNCAAEQLAGNAGRAGQGQLVSGDQAPAGSELLELRMAIESDHQYYYKWDDLQACFTYTVALLDAASARYEEQMGIILTYPYLQLHTTPDDGWYAQDNGGNCSDVLHEFRDAWGEQIPMGATLGHFLSGANLGCGVAWLNGLCYPGYAYAVSGNLTGGVTFPISPGSNTWDFVVFTHETGHNCGAAHTHSYCPPIDTCDFNCTGSTTCTPGTNMSYCHQCGGMGNISTYFHPQIVDIIRTKVENSCVGKYDGRQEVVLFEDDFESGDFAAGGWTSSNMAKVSGAAGFLSGHGVRIRRSGWIERTIDTTGYDSIKVYYTRRTKNFDTGESLRLRYDMGNGWQTAEIVTTKHWGSSYLDVPAFALPEEAVNNPALRIRFKANGDESTERGDVDDVIVTGRQ